MCAAKRRRRRFGQASGRQGRRDDLGVFVRSSWEANYARYLNLLISFGDVVTWAYEPRRFEFPDIKRGTTSYLPDFRIEFSDGRTEYHEVKGFWTSKAKTAVKRFRKRYPDETLVIVDGKRYEEIRAEYAAKIPGWE